MGCDKESTQLFETQKDAYDKILQNVKESADFWNSIANKLIDADKPKLKPGDIVEVDGVKRRVSRIDAMGEPVYNDLPKW